MPDRFVIVGGGITGLALAWELTRLGARDVTVVEARYTGAGGSGRNVGRIRALQLTPELATFMRAARDKHARLRDELGMQTLFWRAGYAWLLYEDEELELMGKVNVMLRELGIDSELLDARATTSRFPILRGGDRPLGALVGPDAVVHHDACLYAYRKACLRAGVRVLERTRVVSVLKRGDRVHGVGLEDEELPADLVVNAAGGWARELSALAGLQVPNAPLRREVLVTEPSKPFMSAAVTFYRPSEGWFNQTLRGELVAGVVHPEEPVGMNQHSSFTFLRRTAAVVIRKAPRLGRLRVIRQWAGVYDMTPDRKPLVGPAPGLPGFVQANGYSGRGFAQAPLVAELLARWMLHGEQPDLLRPFDPGRFRDLDVTTPGRDYYGAYDSSDDH